jgi:hypothetical protein
MKHVKTVKGITLEHKFILNNLFFYFKIIAQNIVTWGLTARIVEGEKQPLLGSGCVNKQQYQSLRQATSQLATIEELLEAVFSVQSVLGLYRKVIWTSPGSLQWVKVRGWLEMVTSLWGREPRRRGTSIIGSNVTENTGVCAVVICKVYSRAVLVSNKSDCQSKTHL